MKFNEVFEAFLAGKGIAYKYPVGQYEVYRLYKSKTLIKEYMTNDFGTPSLDRCEITNWLPVDIILSNAWKVVDD